MTCSLTCSLIHSTIGGGPSLKQVALINFTLLCTAPYR